MLDQFGRRYQGRFVFNADGPCRPEDLQALEAEIGLQLPAAYRGFITAVGGGELHYAIQLPASPDGDPVVFHDLNMLSPQRPGKYGEGTLLGEHRRRDKDRLRDRFGHDSFLPIAFDIVEDGLWLDLSDDGFGRVFADIEAHDRWTGVLQEEDFLGVVADSFDGYLDRLFLDSETAADLWEPLEDSKPDHALLRALEAWFDADLPGWREDSWARRPSWATV
jgi:hypothetical protein